MTLAYRDATVTLVLTQMRTKMSVVGGCDGDSKLMVGARGPLLHRRDNERPCLGGDVVDSAEAGTVRMMTQMRWVGTAQAHRYHPPHRHLLQHLHRLWPRPHRHSCS
jgi:hypothetical protein